MDDFHARLPPGGTYILLVGEANESARRFYEHHGLVVESYVDGNSHCSDAMHIDLDTPPPPASGVLMRFTKTALTREDP